MCNPQTFDSRDSRYKRPYGAVPSGTRVELALRPPRAGGFSAATLIAYFEHRDEERRELPMPWRGLEGDRDVFDIALETGDYVGLVNLRHRLNDALRQGAGHIGYGIRKEYRGRGYATAALALALKEAWKIVPEEEIYLSVHKDNPASLKVQLRNGARVDHEDGVEYYTRIPRP